MITRFVLSLLLDLLANVVGYLFNPVVVLFAGADGRLPRALAWFGTPDATLDGVGASGWIDSRFLAATEHLRRPDLQPRDALCRYLCRVMWLYRNNVNGFSTFVTGAPGPFFQMSLDINLFLPVRNQNALPSDRYPAQGGRMLRVWRGADGCDYFSLRYVKDRGNGRCYEAYIGWKIEPTTSDAARAMLVARWTPFRKFEADPV